MSAQHGTLAVTAQIADLLAALNQDIYIQPLPLFQGSTIGQHIRHILEFYTCLFEGRACARVDYSSRARNIRIAEQLDVARALLDGIADTVDQLDEHQWLNIDSEFGEPIEGDDRPVYISSMGRELQYAFDHAVHHLAIIRMGIQVYFPDVVIDPELGVAPSTLRFRKMLAG